ncbi:hypothetical protein RV11_GL001737 [Enterococcus phoeniculicola]|jgi:hypothetical protein|uniref:Uncharacterized protein n=1 Tax=Enterococcus phoeniculicola ATCC BAA-412 TaxID=1158610 RepID=R3TZN7_9ENTE|nr:MGMT family protein [Enterococcus phoeniculicola]EOL46643.1 hypothetical protein UC3_00763 [Enterococcus phoeniculicola ATCC BAA-412]EOT77196.1 hypothetical protein I589_02158 [Enterococcus phoeniculicola ATCC BAA-412]OJG70025.1 hypothetical protein RV11_GL001737 [Enterococcus phoeniculicola]
MSNEKTKNFNQMLHENKGMPKLQLIIDKKSIEKYGGNRMFFAPPSWYDLQMKRVPTGQVITTGELRQFFATQNDADFTDPITAGIFISIAAWASYQRETDLTPYWRTLKANGELHPKYPGGIEAQIKLLEAEGHTIRRRGRKNFKYYVENSQASLFDLSAN